MQEILKKHGQYIQDFAQGKFPDGIQNDPRNNKDPDEKIDLKSLSAYQPGLSKQKTMLKDEGREVKAVSEGADKYVNKFVEIARKKKEER